MKCPTCNDTPLVMAERQGVEIDYCPDCRGIWLDRGELDKLLDAPWPLHRRHHLCRCMRRQRGWACNAQQAMAMGVMVTVTTTNAKSHGCTRSLTEL